MKYFPRWNQWPRRRNKLARTNIQVIYISQEILTVWRYLLSRQCRFQEIKTIPVYTTYYLITNYLLIFSFLIQTLSMTVPSQDENECKKHFFPFRYAWNSMIGHGEVTKFVAVNIYISKMVEISICFYLAAIEVYWLDLSHIYCVAFLCK